MDVPLGRPALGLIYETVSYGKSDQLVDAVQVQLFHDAAAVGVHRVDTEVEDDGDLFVGLAFGQHLKHFALPAAQQIDGVGDVLAVVVEDGVRDGWAQIAFSGGDGPDGGDQVGGAGILEEITAGPGPQDLADIDGILVHAEGKHPRMGIGGGKAAGGFDAVELRHGDIHDDHIRAQLGGQVDSFPAVTGFADDFHVGLGAEDHLEAVAHHGVVVSQQDANAFHRAEGPAHQLEHPDRKSTRLNSKSPMYL